jgi:hypothetical protein
MSSNPNSSMFEDLIESGDINKSAEEALSGNSETPSYSNDNADNIEPRFFNS